MTHTQIKCKCLMCGLHFVICTWHPERHTVDSIYCPECGRHGENMMTWVEEVPGMIFQVVPGSAQPATLKMKGDN